MPIGVIINSGSVILGGIVGTFFGTRLQQSFKDNMNMIFGCCAMAMGVNSLCLMENMPAVIFAVIIGTALGMAVHLGQQINHAATGMQHIVSRFIRSDHSSLSEEEFTATLVTIIVLFCASGTGIYGSIVAGMTGDHSILIAKSILDFFTAAIFACTLGAVVSLVALPQFLIFCALFLAAGLIFPLTTDSMINDFKACGGLLMLATGFRMIKVCMFPVADMLPGMLLIMPLSAFWTNCILPFVS